MSEIAEFYKDKNVFITGATGFMGKVLVEKLLFSCPNIGNIYVLMRPKYGKVPSERVNALTQMPLFDRLKKKRPGDLSKIIVIEGDTEIEGLGIGNQDLRRLEDEVDVVFHAAATVRFTAELYHALTVNVAATHSIIKICQRMKRLKVFVHVSTAFCNVDQVILEEKVYKESPLDPLELIREMKETDLEDFMEDAERIMDPHPNSYTFTKRLSEVLLCKFYPEIPIVIIRPSIVFPSVREPIPGWVDNLNGPVALSVAGGKGALRSMYMIADEPVNFVPVDIAVSAMIVASWKHAILPREPELPAYNVSFCENGSWRDIIEIGKKIVVKYPFEALLWYPGGVITESLFIHNAKVFMYQWIPAYIIDALLRLLKKKPFMVRVQEKIKDGMVQVRYFTTRKDGWNFKTEKFRALTSELSKADREMFPMDPIPKKDTYNYIQTCLLGTRQYCLNEKPESIPACQKRIKYYYAADVFVKGFFLLMLMWMLSAFCSSAFQTYEKWTH